MKRLLMFWVIISILLIFAACGNGAVEEEYTHTYPEEIYEPYVPEEIYEPETSIEYDEEPDCEPEPIIESVIPLDVALYYFQRLEELWDTDNGEIWGTPLHAPVVIVCAETRDAVANMPDPLGRLTRQYVNGGAVYVGRYYPQGIVGETAVNWLGQRWGMVSWHYIDMASRHFYYEAVEEYHRWSWWMYDASEAILTVMAHEAFHALQPEMFGIFGGSGVPGAWGATQIYYHLEVNALVKAFSSTDDERLAAINHALSIRHHRRQNFAVARDENLMEVAEGLAVYTVDLRLLLNRDMIEAVVTSMPEMFMSVDSARGAAIMFGYFSGALYGLLLEDLGIDWKGYVDPNTDLGQLLKEALEITDLTPFENIDLTPYGYEEISARLR